MLRRNREQVQYFIGPSAEALTDHSSISRMLETGLNHANVQLEAQLAKGERQLAGLQLSHLDTSYMQPLTLMLYSRLDISSERWEVQQRVAVARGDLNLSGSGCDRPFMMTGAAFGRVEAKYMERLADLWNSPKQWTTIPPQCLTPSSGLCLRVLARQGAAVEQLLAHPHRQFPFAVFQLLETPEEASNMVTIPECRKDTWTLATQKQYPDLRGDDFLATLTLHAHLQSTISLTLRRSMPPSDASSLRDLYRLGP